ncbi:MAG: methyltransferase domain-containing protein [Planctomycetes bacterium]|nr:methyltransferase domain-containing protein [Planctomycetota bacterium]
MDRSFLVRWFGFPATLIHGDTLVYDRWQWLRARLPVTDREPRLIDIGCGTGAFTIGAGRRGYRGLGLSWDEANQREARRRAEQCQVANVEFDVCDVRYLDQRDQYRDQYDVAICLEVIEHVLDDERLMRGIARCVKPGGRVLLTTPSFHYRAITPSDDGPFRPVEDGGHVRRGYTPERLLALCHAAGLVEPKISYCSGFLSQKITWLLRVIGRWNHWLAWAAILPLRPFVPWCDPLLSRLIGWPYYSIALEARRPESA